MSDPLPLDRLREAERLFASKLECSPAVNRIGRELLREYQSELVRSDALAARLDAAEKALRQVAEFHIPETRNDYQSIARAYFASQAEGSPQDEETA